MQIEDLRNSAWRFNSRLRFVMARGEVMAEEYEPVVKEIIKQVREKGDTALLEYTKRFDGEELTEEDLEVPYEELEKAYEEIEPEVRTALEVANERIRRFHEKQLERVLFGGRGWDPFGNEGLSLRKGWYICARGQGVLPLHRPYERGAGGCGWCGRGDYGFPKTQQIHFGVCLHCGC
jgi:histidinol dehydrogenase (EC 1.1.1.23)